MGRAPAPAMLPVYARVLAMLDSGVSINETARILNAEGVPTARGATWYPSTVRGIRDSRAVTARV